MAHSLANQHIIIKIIEPFFLLIRFVYSLQLIDFSKELIYLILKLKDLFMLIGLYQTISQLQLLGKITPKLYVLEGSAIHGDTGKANFKLIGELHLHLSSVFYEALTVLLPVPSHIDVQDNLLWHFMTLRILQHGCQITDYEFLYPVKLLPQLHLVLQIEVISSQNSSSLAISPIFTFNDWKFVLLMCYISRLLFHYVMPAQSFYLSLLKSRTFCIQSRFSHTNDLFKLCPFVFFVLQLLICLICQDTPTVQSQNSFAKLLYESIELLEGLLAPLQDHPQQFALFVDHLCCQTSSPDYQLVLNSKRTRNTFQMVVV